MNVWYVKNEVMQDCSGYQSSDQNFIIAYFRSLHNFNLLGTGTLTYSNVNSQKHRVQRIGT